MVDFKETKEPKVEVISSFYEYITLVLTRLVETWKAGEGDIIIEVRDDSGRRKAKIKGGPTDRVG